MKTCMEKAKQWWKSGVAVTVIGFVHVMLQDDGDKKEMEKQMERKWYIAQRKGLKSTLEEQKFQI